MSTTSPRQFERFLKLDELIRQKQGKTVRELAEKLEVSERTLHADLISFDAPSLQMQRFLDV